MRIFQNLSKAAGLLLLMALLSDNQVQAQIIVSDEFSYTASTNLSGQNGGAPLGNPGWTGTWTKTNNAAEVTMTVTSSGLNYTDGLGNVLTVAGNAVADTSNAAKMADYRAFTPPVGTFNNGNSVWLSALVNATSYGNSNIQVFMTQSQDPGNGGGYGFSISSAGVFVQSGVTTSQVGAATGSTGSTFLIVAKLTFNSNPALDTVTGWLNPNLDTTPTSGGTTITGAINTSTTYLAVRGGTQMVGTVDELRLGNTFADVVPFTGAAVPEPSTYAMISLGLFGLVLLQRRRKETESHRLD